MRRVVVTGIGLVTPLAGTADRTWELLIQGKSGVGPITRFDASDLSCRIAGEVRVGTENNQFDAEKYVSSKDMRKMDDFIIYGMGAAIQAIEDSEWLPTEEHDLDMTGVMLGSGIGGLRTIEDNSIMVHENGPRRLSPFFIPASLINLLSGHISIKYGFSGPNQSVVTACSTGAHAIGDAARIIQSGDADVMIAGGAESSVCRIGMSGFASARALSTNFNDCPEKASRPWDKDRDGFVMGEGSGVLVLEEYEHAKKRGAKIYGELVGYGSTGDGYHITSPHPEGRGGFRSMQMALNKSGLSLADIGYVNAHGTSTPMGDEVELGAVVRLFGTEAKHLSMSSTKSSMGHLLGAAGSVEAILSILAMNNGVVPPTLNLDNPPENCEIDLVPKVAKEKKFNAAMSNSFGFGGTNATLIFKKI
jgi:3-oxoacyl-[acyl-carrier-protein] synthase II